MVSLAPHVTVIVPAYNHAKYIRNCLSTIATQTYSNFDLLVIDDASTDETADIAEQWIYSHPEVRCTLIKRPENGGLCASLNEALVTAEGEILVLLASDDWLAPEHIAECVSTFNDHPRAVVVYSDLICVAEDGELLHQSWFEAWLEAWPPPQGLIYRQLLEKNFVPAPGTAVRAEPLRQVGGYDETLLIEDYDAWLRLAPVGEFRWTGSSTVFYRSTPEGLTLSTDPFVQAQQLAQIFEKHVDRQEVSSTALRRKADHVKGMYAYARTPAQKKAARRALRECVLATPTTVLVLYSLAAHLGISYKSVAHVRSLMRSSLFLRLGRRK